MHRIVNQLFQDQAVIYQKDKVPFDRIMAPCPSIVGRYPYVKTNHDFVRTLGGMFSVAQRCLSDDGTITFSCHRDSEQEWAAWLSNNPGVFEEVPNSRMLVWNGYRRDLMNNDVFVGTNIEYMRFKTFRRVGSNATMNDVTIPDDVVMDPYNRVDKGNFLAPIDRNKVLNEADEWCIKRGCDPVEHIGRFVDPFKYWMVEFDHDMGTYIQIPKHPTRDDNFRWGMTEHQHAHIMDASLKGTNWVLAGHNKHRVYGMWLCYWMMQKFCNPGEKVLLPFAGDGEMTLAGLIHGVEITAVDASTPRAKLNEDIVVEWMRKFG